MKNKATAQAEPTVVPDEKPKGPIKGVSLTRISRGDVSYPAAVYKGTAPAKGSKITVQLENGALYSGIIHDATEADGEVIAEFRDGLKPA